MCLTRRFRESTAICAGATGKPWSNSTPKPAKQGKEAGAPGFPRCSTPSSRVVYGGLLPQGPPRLQGPHGRQGGPGCEHLGGERCGAVQEYSGVRPWVQVNLSPDPD